MNGLDWATSEASGVRYVHWQNINRCMISPFYSWLLPSLEKHHLHFWNHMAKKGIIHLVATILILSLFLDGLLIFGHGFDHQSKTMKKIEAFLLATLCIVELLICVIWALFSFHVRHSTGNSLEKRAVLLTRLPVWWPNAYLADHLLELYWDCAFDSVGFSVISIKFDLFNRKFIF